MKTDYTKIPEYSKLVEATFAALKALGNSGKNNEINEKAIEILGLSDEVCSIPHLKSSSLSEVHYRLAWARTLLKNYGAIENSARSVWSITSDFNNVDTVENSSNPLIFLPLVFNRYVDKHQVTNNNQQFMLNFFSNPLLFLLIFHL